jgi:hypothetical protein
VGMIAVQLFLAHSSLYFFSLIFFLFLSLAGLWWDMFPCPVFSFCDCRDTHSLLVTASATGVGERERERESESECVFVCDTLVSYIFLLFHAKQISILNVDEIRSRIKWVCVREKEREIWMETEGCDFFTDYIRHCCKWKSWCKQDHCWI